MSVCGEMGNSYLTYTKDLTLNTRREAVSSVIFTRIKGLYLGARGSSVT